MNLKEAVEKELRRGPCSTMDAMFLAMLRSDYEGGRWRTNRMDVVRRKYAINKS